MGDEKCNAIRIALENIGGLGPSFAYLTHSTAAFSTQCTGLGKKASARFGEFYCCCCLPLLPELAYSILTTWQKPFSRPLYILHKADIVCFLAKSLTEHTGQINLFNGSVEICCS